MSAPKTFLRNVFDALIASRTRQAAREVASYRLHQELVRTKNDRF